jgi:hypothetical protein
MRFRLSAAGRSPRKPRLDAEPHQIGSVADKAALPQVLHPRLQRSPVSTILPLLRLHTPLVLLFMVRTSGSRLATCSKVLLFWILRDPARRGAPASCGEPRDSSVKCDVAVLLRLSKQCSSFGQCLWTRFSSRSAQYRRDVMVRRAIYNSGSHSAVRRPLAISLTFDGTPWRLCSICRRF